MPARIASFFRNLLRKRAVEQALDDELQSAVELLTQEKMNEGLWRSEARRQALIELGGVEQVKQEVRAIRFGRFLETFAQDLRFGLRTMAKSPGFTAVAVLTLALGVGANTAFFGVVNTTLFRALPYPHPEQLVHINERITKSNASMPVSYPNFVDWKRQQTSFSVLAMYSNTSLNLTTETGTDRMSALLVDHDFLKALDVQPARGRDFTADDDRIGAPLTMLITHATWSRRFNSDPGIVGRAVEVDGKSATIVGILPPAFQFFRRSDLLLPLGPFVEQLYMQTRDNHSNAMVVARLKPGLSLLAAREEMDSISTHLAELYPKSNSGNGVNLTSLRQYLVGDAKPRQLLLMSAVGLVLLIVCVNVATLSLARSYSRDHEMAVRAALGAGRGRLMRQLLTEPLLLAVIGGGLGLLLATALSATLGSLVPFQLRQLDPSGASAMDLRVAAFAFIITLLTGLGFGLAPAWRLSHARPNDALKDRAVVGKSSLGFRTADLLVVAQVGLASLLIVAAGLVLRSLWSLSREPLGYQPENMLSLHLASPAARMGYSLTRVGAFYEEAAERLARLPGVTAAAVTSNLPYGEYDSRTTFRLLDRPIPAPSEYPSAPYRIISRDYFRAMGIPLQQGRFFSGEEPMPSFSSEAPKLDEILAAFRKVSFDGIVTRGFAQHYWPDENPIGKRFLTGNANLQVALVTVVGVVGDTSEDKLGQTNHEEFYLSLRQYPAPLPEYSLVLRTRGDPSALIEAAKAELRHMTTNEAVYDVRPVSSRISESMSTQTFQTQIISLFAGLALLLASVGLYGLLAFNVRRRSREIGIRLALGASPKDVFESVILRGLALVIPGLTLGLLGAWALGHCLQNLLYRVSPTDPLTYALGALALLLSAFLACWLPARRAMRVDPMVALRYE